MTLLIRIESNILDVVLRVALVFELSVVTKAFSFNDNRKLINIDLQTCQFILKAIVSAGILLFWLVKSFYSLLLDQEKKKSPSIFCQHIHQSSFLETVFDILYVLLCQQEKRLAIKFMFLCCSARSHIRNNAGSMLINNI